MEELKVWLFELEFHEEQDRGNLSVLGSDNLPFDVKRLFWIRDVQGVHSRGGHAHKECHQVIIPIGCVDIYVDGELYTFFDCDNYALYVPPGHKVSMRGFGKCTSVLVLCSHEYDPEDYIYD